VDESKIEEYLAKQGITSMQDQGIKKFVMKRKKGGHKRKVNNKDNQHMAGVLVDYSEGGLAAPKGDR
jgi:transcription initiation factor TFIIE subunit beta